MYWYDIVVKFTGRKCVKKDRFVGLDGKAVLNKQTYKMGNFEL